MAKAYEEIVNFIAEGVSTSQVASWKPSVDAVRRVEQLLAREKTDGLSTEEEAELNHFLELEHLMRLASARARSLSGHG